jgi:superfamily I DNA and/or RNA helicase
VIDEASQAITPAILLTIPYLRQLEGNESERMPVIVMAGDHQQLPPTVLSGKPPKIHSLSKAENRGCGGTSLGSSSVERGR